MGWDQSPDYGGKDPSPWVEAVLILFVFGPAAATLVLLPWRLVEWLWSAAP